MVKEEAEAIYYQGKEVSGYNFFSLNYTTFLLFGTL